MQGGLAKNIVAEKYQVRVLSAACMVILDLPLRGFQINRI